MKLRTKGKAVRPRALSSATRAGRKTVLVRRTETAPFEPLVPRPDSRFDEIAREFFATEPDDTTPLTPLQKRMDSGEL
jgi:hypothetical protein